MGNYYLAIDIGASSGRHILGHMENGTIKLEEIHRFENGMEERNGHLCWNHDKLFEEILKGLAKCKEQGKIPVSMGIDTWGVDFVLLDEQDRIHNVKYTNGCDGNLKAISKLTEGMEATKVIELLSDNQCKDKGTSCADQFSKALRKALSERG